MGVARLGAVDRSTSMAFASYGAAREEIEAMEFLGSLLERALAIGEAAELPRIRRAIRVLVDAARQRGEAFDGVSRTCSPSRRPASIDQVNALRQEGEYWTFEYRGEVCRIRNRVGLSHLAALLARPHEAVPALTLAAGVGDGDGGGTPPSPELRTAPPDDLGEILDVRARRDYRERLEDLASELIEAEEMHDLGRVGHLRAERDALASALSSALGLGGRLRRAGSPAERARVRVTSALRKITLRIRAENAPLGSHLVRSIRTGTYCCYAPPEPTRWTVIAARF